MQLEEQAMVNLEAVARCQRLDTIGISGTGGPSPVTGVPCWMVTASLGRPKGAGLGLYEMEGIECMELTAVNGTVKIPG